MKFSSPSTSALWGSGKPGRPDALPDLMFTATASIYGENILLPAALNCSVKLPQATIDELLDTSLVLEAIAPGARLLELKISCPVVTPPITTSNRKNGVTATEVVLVKRSVALQMPVAALL